MKLEHQVALITGASHGLGLATARSLAAEGAAIACLARPGPLKGAFLTLKSALPWLIERKRGTIVGIASLWAWVGQPNASAYAAAKWGLRGLLESVALEVKPYGIRVSIVSPHNMNSAGRAISSESAERLHHLEPSEVASLIAFLCTAPDHVAVGNVTVWPVGAGIVSQG